jgi:hypothetical protein
MMDKLVDVFGPIVIGAFVIQRLIELLDPLVDSAFGLKEGDASADKKRRLIFGLISMAAGLFLAFGIGLRVLKYFDIEDRDFWDGLATAIIISAGTEGSNSVLKILEYFKANLKSGENGGQGKRRQKAGEDSSAGADTGR